jgi:septal ring factor EnvC (AmiA/AmiB activator)
MEKLLNIVKSKQNMRNEESMMLLGFLTKEFELVKKHFIDVNKNSSALKAYAEEKNEVEAEAAREKAKERVKTDEERALKAKMNTKHRADTKEEQSLKAKNKGAAGSNISLEAMAEAVEAMAGEEKTDG